MDGFVLDYYACFRTWQFMNYAELLTKIENYKQKYQVCLIGKSSLGREIYAVEKCVDDALSTAVFVAGIHAREHISTDLLCKFLDDGLFDKIYKFNICLILMANPDGVELSCRGLDSVLDENLKFKLLKINNFSPDFSLWKANLFGVDLNNNFDANFGQNSLKSKPSSQGFAGDYFR